METKDNTGTTAVALRLLAALDEYMREMASLPRDCSPGDSEAPARAFVALQAHAARLPFTSAAWLEVFISRAELTHADRAGLSGEAAHAHFTDCLDRHLDALHRMRLACLEWHAAPEAAAAGRRPTLGLGHVR